MILVRCHVGKEDIPSIAANNEVNVKRGGETSTYFSPSQSMIRKERYAIFNQEE